MCSGTCTSVGKYRDVILPMVVIRRLDAVLEPTKDAVLKMRANLDKVKVANQEAALRKASGQAFYNASPFTLKGPQEPGEGRPAQGGLRVLP